MKVPNENNQFPVRSEIGGTDSVPGWTVNHESMRLLRILNTPFCGDTISHL